MSTTALYYYEAHVTIEPVFDEQREQLATIAQTHKFRLAELLMKKRSEDTEARSKHDTFMTGHGKDLVDITTRMEDLVHAARQAGYKVWRYKIEDTLMDSRVDDVLGILEPT